MPNQVENTVDLKSCCITANIIVLKHQWLNKLI